MGVLCMPAMDKLYRRLIIFVAIIAMANLPDWPIPSWGHFRLVASHSIIVNGAGIVCLVVGLHLQGALLRKPHRRVIIGLIVAWVWVYLSKGPVAVAMNRAGGYDNHHPRAQP